MTTRAVYQQELDALAEDVLGMGEALRRSIEAVVGALETMDAVKAAEIIEGDDKIDTLERTIETKCIELIAKQAPLATDLRKISSYMRMIADIERIADHCSDISEYIMMLANEKAIPMPGFVREMTQEMKRMVWLVIESFVSADREKASLVIAMDDTVDDYFEKIKDELCIAMKHNTDRIPQYVDYIMIIKYVERMADHCTNIAHWIQFIITGELEL